MKFLKHVVIVRSTELSLSLSSLKEEKLYNVKSIKASLPLRNGSSTPLALGHFGLFKKNRLYCWSTKISVLKLLLTSTKFLAKEREIEFRQPQSRPKSGAAARARRATATINAFITLGA